MSPREIFALRDHLGAELKGRTLSDARDVVSLTDILSQTVLGGRLRELSGRTVLLKVSDQLRSGVAMIELDGIARRMLLCPPDLNPAHLDALIADAGIDAEIVLEPRDQDREGERVESGFVQRKVVGQRRKVDLLLRGDLFHRRHDP